MALAMAYVVALPIVVTILVNKDHLGDLPKWLMSEVGAAWVQAITSFLAIGAAGLGLLYQEGRRDREAKARAISLAGVCGTVAHQAIRHVTDRMEPLLKKPDAPFLFLLRGHRTTEMVNALREIEIVDLPSDVVAPLVAIRGAVYAVNSRITDIFKIEEGDKGAKDRRLARLESAGRVLGDAVEQYGKLQDILSINYEINIPSIIVGDIISDFIAKSRLVSESSGYAYD